MKAGDLVRHTGKPEWGAGVVVECAADKCTIHFESKGRLVLQVAVAAPHLAEVARSDLASDSALLDRQRWSELSLPEEQRAKKRKAAASTRKTRP
jgi:hypothetical protein